MNTKEKLKYEKDFVYDNEAFNEALKIAEQTAIKKDKFSCTVIFICIFAIPCIILGIITKKAIFYAFSIFFIITWISALNTFKKEYIKENSVEYEKQLWNSNRKLSIYDNHINVYAEYNPNETYDSDLTDEDIASIEEEREEISNFNFEYGKFYIYENENAFLFYKYRNKNQIIMKKYFSDSEIPELEELFEVKAKGKYKYI